MFNKEVIERLKQKNWFVMYNRDIEKLEKILDYCTAANIKWNNGDMITKECIDDCKIFEGIYYGKTTKGITKGLKHYSMFNYANSRNVKNITDWFFDTIDKFENCNKSVTENLSPSNPKEQMFVNAVLGWLRGRKLQFKTEKSKHYLAYNSCKNHMILFRDNVYHIKPEPVNTPITISDSLWNLIDPKYRCVVLNECNDSDTPDSAPENFYLSFHECTPVKSKFGNRWEEFNPTTEPKIILLSDLNIDISNVNWDTSLTVRPKDC